MNLDVGIGSSERGLGVTVSVLGCAMLSLLDGLGEAAVVTLSYSVRSLGFGNSGAFRRGLWVWV
jgi:hypothetical protein